MSQKPQQEFEKDPVWDLLDAASKQEPSPLFSRNVMRAIRLETEHVPLWKRMLSPRPALASLAAVAACTTITLAILQQQPDSTNVTPSPVVSSASSPDTSQASAIDQIASEYNVPEDLDDIIDPLMLISVMVDSSDYSLDELDL